MSVHPGVLCGLLEGFGQGLPDGDALLPLNELTPERLLHSVELLDIRLLELHCKVAGVAHD